MYPSVCQSQVRQCDISWPVQARITGIKRHSCVSSDPFDTNRTTNDIRNCENQCCRKVVPGVLLYRWPLPLVASDIKWRWIVDTFNSDTEFHLKRCLLRDIVRRTLYNNHQPVFHYWVHNLHGPESSHSITILETWLPINFMANRVGTSMLLHRTNPVMPTQGISTFNATLE